MANHQAIKAVREQRGLSLQAVATFAAIAPKNLESFENGEKEPSRKQAERLSNIYGVPLYVLFTEGIPNLLPLPVDFRKSELSPAIISPKGVAKYWAAERISHFTHDLVLGLRFKATKLFPRENGLERSPRKIASNLRETFDDWHGQRAKKLNFSGDQEQRFLGALRLFFEIQGCVVNVNDAPSRDFLGFYVQPEAGMPTIFVNRSIQSKKAQLFTLTHEIAHYLIDAEGISNPYRLKNKVERICNVFAAEFLAPMERFSKLAERPSTAIRQSVDEYISFVSRRSLLSKLATAIRLVEGGYLSQGQLRNWSSSLTKSLQEEKDDEKEEAESSKHGVPHAKRLGELGYLPIFLSFCAVKEKLIDKYDVAAGIGLSETLQERAYSLAARRIEIANSK